MLSSVSAPAATVPTVISPFEVLSDSARRLPRDLSSFKPLQALFSAHLLDSRSPLLFTMSDALSRCVTDGQKLKGLFLCTDLLSLLSQVFICYLFSALFSCPTALSAKSVVSSSFLVFAPKFWRVKNSLRLPAVTLAMIILLPQILLVLLIHALEMNPAPPVAYLFKILL